MDSAPITLLLLPGMDGTGELFEPFVAAVGQEISPKILRYPADMPLGYAELESFARMAIPVTGSYMVLGESFSGPVAVALATDASPRLKGLVLCCSFVRNPHPLFAGLRPLLRWFPGSWLPLGLLGRLLMGRFATLALQQALAQAMRQVLPPVLRARLQAVLGVDMSARMASVRVPVLYLRATEDRVVPASAGALVASLNARTEIVDIAGPHFLLQAAADDAALAIQGFVRQLHQRK